MMTPVEIIGLVSAVITFIDFAAENVAVAREIAKSGSAATKGNADLERRIKLLDDQINDVHLSGPGSARDVHEAELLNLVDEYKDLTVRLVSFLDGLKSTKKRHILWKSAKNFLKKEEKESFVQDLDNCRSRIHLQLNIVMRQDLGRRLDEISNLGHTQMAEIRHLRSSTQTLEATMNTWKHVPEFVDQIRLIISQSKTNIDRHAQKQILEELWIDGMENRFGEVDQAHESTFSWILDPDLRLEKETPLESQARRQVVDWFLQGHGIFYIAGKPGSGKSTLMKYLSQNPKTQEYLRTWAGEKSLVTANFFFWRLGTDVQKSLDGLRRALLYSVLEELPTLVETVFPQQWKSVIEERPLTIRASDVDAALKSLLGQPDFLSSHKIAFFIDGLDEFDGDHDKMVRILLKWASEHGENVKLCVSSREWEIFRQRLARYPKIRLQDITARDIRSYVNEELLENEDFVGYSLQNPKVLALVETITDKAEGVFLWVKITLRGLKWSLLSGDRLEHIEERIDALPNELEALYQSIFDSMRNGSHMNRIDRMRAMRTLLTALPCKNEPNDSHPPWLLISYSFLNDYDQDQGFALKLPIQSINRRALDDRLEWARKLVYQRCMGLLETYTIHADDRPRYWRRGPETRRFSESTTNEHIEQIPQDDTDIRNNAVHFEAADNRSVGEESYYYSDGTADTIDENERDSEYLHRNARYNDSSKINHQFPSREGIRCIHRTVYEFLAQPQIEELMRADSLEFNEADFKLQTFLATIKTFRPSVHYAKRNFIYDAYDLLIHYRSAMGKVAEARFLAGLKEVARVLQHHGLIVDYILPSENAALFVLGTQKSHAPYDALLLLATRIGASKGLCSLSGTELARRLQHKGNNTDAVLSKCV